MQAGGLCAARSGVVCALPRGGCCLTLKQHGDPNRASTSCTPESLVRRTALAGIAGTCWHLLALVHRLATWLHLLGVQVKARERNIRLPWSALQHHLDLIAHVGRDSWRYRHVYRSGEFYITDSKQLVTSRPKLPSGAGWQ